MRKYPVTYLLAAVNICFFVSAAYLGLLGELVHYYGFSLANVMEGNYISLVVSGFLHTGLPHLFYNSVFLVLFGRAVEEEFGHVKTVAVYFAGMFAGEAFFAALFPTASAVGASGAVFGLMAAGTLVEPGRPVHEKFLPLPISLIGVLYLLPAVGNAFSLAGDVANIAHVGGAVAGSVLAFLWRPEQAKKGVWAVAGFTFLVIGIGYF
ncbi:MAG: rhomboid family intramembrane serine protease [Candidatus Nanohaloarchaea archaeon]